MSLQPFPPVALCAQVPPLDRFLSCLTPMSRSHDEMARHLHGGVAAPRRRRRSTSRSDSRAPLRRPADSEQVEMPGGLGRADASPRHERADAPAADGLVLPGDAPTTWYFELPVGMVYSDEAMGCRLQRPPWSFSSDLESHAATGVFGGQLSWASAGLLQYNELIALFAQPQGLHQDVSSDLLHSTLARRLRTLAWQAHSQQLAALQATSSSQHNDLATEQMRVNTQLASALDRLAKGNRAAKHPLLRDHESEDEELEKFDLASSLGKASHSFLPNDWFPSNHLLAKLQKLLSKARDSRKHQDHPFIADTALESWVPMWVGHGHLRGKR